MIRDFEWSSLSFDNISKLIIFRFIWIYFQSYISNMVHNSLKKCILIILIESLRPFISLHPAFILQMPLQVEILHERSITVWAAEWLQPDVHTHVCFHVLKLGVVPFAIFARKKLIWPWCIVVADAHLHVAFVVVVTVLLREDFHVISIIWFKVALVYNVPIELINRYRYLSCLSLFWGEEFTVNSRLEPVIREKEVF